jgi:hypothetical protein
MNFEYVKQYYGVPAELGRAVIVSGKPGVIVADRGHHIGVVFDGDDLTAIYPCHPTSEVVYGEIVPLPKAKKMTRSQENYQRYIDSEADCSFAEWMGFGKYRRKKSWEW